MTVDTENLQFKQQLKQLRKPCKLLAAASEGGHWKQLQRLRPAFSGWEVLYIRTTVPGVKQSRLGETGVRLVSDGNRSSPLSLMVSFAQILWIVGCFRPHVVISTGAAPGYLALVAGKLFRAGTIWIDSMANAEEMSMAGKWARPWSDVWATQWPHLAGTDGPVFIGSIL